MPADGHTNNFQSLASSLNIWFFLKEFFFQKTQHKIMDLEI